MPAPRLGAPGLARPPAPRQPAAQRARHLLGELFPEPAQGPAGVTGAGRWAAFLLIQVAAVGAGTAVMLVRFSGRQPWHSIYAEDLGIYLPAALAHPWHLLQSYGGYLQLVPRLIAQLVSLLPLRDAAAGFAVAGALVASGCGLFCYHACAGQVRSRWLRVLAGLSVVLLPVAQLEIADNGVNTPWYLIVALFWAILWRPRSRGGAWVAAVVAFLAAASSSLVLVLAPLVAARAIVVPWRAREHAVTAGWAAGALLLIAAADACLLRWRPRAQAVAAVVAVTAILAVGWAWDFRYPVGRMNAPVWQQTVQSWQNYCQRSPAGSITVSFPDYWGPAPLNTTFSCSSLRR